MGVHMCTQKEMMGCLSSKGNRKTTSTINGCLCKIQATVMQDRVLMMLLAAVMLTGGGAS